MFHSENLYAVTSGKNVTWGKTTKESQSNDLYDITYNRDKVYVAVGDDGVILRSTDAKSWESISPKTAENLKAIATDGGQFVAVGTNGVILYSQGGTSWSKANFSAAYTYEKVSGDNKKYLEKDYKVPWKAKVANLETETGSLRLGQYGHSSSKVHISGSFVLQSKNGTKWSARLFDSDDFEKIIFTGKQYTAISASKVSSSTNLITWKTTKPHIRGEFHDIIYNNGKYMAIGWDGNVSARTGTVYTSTNGIKWKAVINKTVIGSGVREDDSTNGKLNGFSDLIMHSVIWDGKQYVIAGFKGMILTSTSGTNWKMRNKMWDVTFEPFRPSDYTGSHTTIKQIIYYGTQYICVGYKNTASFPGKVD